MVTCVSYMSPFIREANQELGGVRMKKLREKTEKNGFQHPTWSAGSIQSKYFTRWSLASAAGVALSVVLAACGSDNSNSTVTPTDNANASMVAAAKSAASSSTVPAELSLKMNASSIAPDTQTDRFIVKYRTGTSERNATMAVQSRLDKLAGAFPARARHQHRMGLGADVITTERKLNAKETKAFMRAMASDPDVEYVEPDTPMSAASAPNDPLFSSQWGLSSDLDPGQTTAGIRAEGAWSKASGAGVVIGLVDSGVTSHSDLDANILPGYDFTFYDRGGDGKNTGLSPVHMCSVADWHGTHVAGIMAAVTNNGVGIAGVAPGAKVVPARVLDGCARGTLSDVADGIMWAAGGPVQGVPTNAHPAKVINASLGASGSCPATMQAAIDYATNHGSVVVVAAMNNADDAAKYQPANCRNVITVGNSARNGTRYYDSNFGPVVDIAAPGDWILSTYNEGTVTPGGESYSYKNGTSMSAPMVSGVVALADSVAPAPLSTAEMRTLIQQNAQRFPATFDWTRTLGAGILDATATVAAAKSGKIPAAADFKCLQGAAGMLVTCTDMSTARGAASIKSWAWNMGFGDPNDMIRTQSVNPYYSYEYPGTYNVRLTVTDSTGAVSTLTRPITVVAPDVTDLSVNVPAKFSANSYVMQYFSLTVPAGAKSVTFTLSPGSYDDIGTLYLKGGSPTTVKAACSSVFARNGVATCTIPNPTAGTYYGTVAPNTDLSGATILASYIQ